MAVTVPPGFYNQGARFALPVTGQVSVMTTPTQILEQNDGRLGVVITNTGTVTVFVGELQNASITKGHALLAGNSISLVSACALYGVVAAGTVTVTYLQEIVR